MTIEMQQRQVSSGRSHSTKLETIALPLLNRATQKDSIVLIALGKISGRCVLDLAEALHGDLEHDSSAHVDQKTVQSALDQPEIGNAASSISSHTIP
jgi:hypothetical protein